MILLDSTTILFEVARHLLLDLDATVITNSPPIAAEGFAEHPSVEVTVLAACSMGEARALVGVMAIGARSVRADVLGVCSLHPDVGITVNALEESWP